MMRQISKILFYDKIKFWIFDASSWLFYTQLVFHITLFYYFGNLFRYKHILLRVKVFISSYNSSFNLFVSVHGQLIPVHTSKFPE